MATQTAPALWWAESDEVLATVIQVLTEQADERKQRRRRKG